MKRGRCGSEESTAASSATTSIQSRSHSLSISLPLVSPPLPPQEYHQHQQQFGSASPKKARSANYEVPRSVKPSILTAMGTLAGGGNNFNNNNNNNASQGSSSSNTHVPMRRRLSGGILDQFIGVDNNTMDGMDIDTNANRHRSMSF